MPYTRTSNPCADYERWADHQEQLERHSEAIRAAAYQEALELGINPENWLTGPRIRNRDCVPYDLGEVLYNTQNDRRYDDKLERLQAELFASNHPAAQELRRIVAAYWADEIYM